MSPHPEVLTLAVRSLGLKVDSSSLDTEVKERLSTEPVEYVKMIEQTRETTEELQILKVLQGHDYLNTGFSIDTSFSCFVNSSMSCSADCNPATFPLP